MNDIQIITSKIKTLTDRPPFMVDSDLAMIYGTSIKKINQAVKRNPDRFPDDFVFQLTKQEAESCGFDEFDGHGGRRFLPYAFAREGCNMLSAVLNTPVAIARSIQIMRAFTAMERGESAVMQVVQGLTEAFKDVSDRLKEIESRPPVNINLPDDSALPLTVERRRVKRSTNSIARNPQARGKAIDLLKEGATYEYVAKVLPSLVPGFSVSCSAVGRFWQDARAGRLKEFGIDVTFH